MNTQIKFYSLAISLLSFNAFSEQAVKTDFSLSSGLEYDSQLSVVELDRLTEQSDTALILKGKANLSWQASPDVTVKAGYGYSSKSYQEYDEFDLTINQLSADVNKKLSHFTLGANYFYADADLADKSFLKLQQASFYGSKLINNRYFFRVASNFKHKAFAQFSQRDANNIGGSVDSFIFFNQAKSFVSFNLSIDSQSANDKVFDYQEFSLQNQYSHQYQAWGLKQKVQLKLNYLERDYQHLTPSLAQKRFDVRQSAQLLWQLDLNSTFTVNTQLEYADYQSNLASADYVEHLASLSLKAGF